MNVFAILFTAFLAVPTAEEEPDHLALAAMMLRDGHPDRAAAALKSVNLEDEELDKPRFYLLQGLVSQKQLDHERAVENMQLAVKHGHKDTLIYVFMAQSQVQLEKYRDCINSLSKAGESALKMPGATLMASYAHKKLNEKDQAYKVLLDGEHRFPKSNEIARQRVILLIELGLYREAVEVASDFFRRDGIKVPDYLALAEALRKSKEFERASVLLEEAKLRHPTSKDIYVQLARIYLDAGHPRKAAMVLEQTIPRHPELAIEAAELYRRAGALNRALYLNRRVLDQKEKAKQRLGLLVEREMFERATALESRLSRLGLLKLDSVRYALAYAHFRTGNHEETIRLISKIKDTVLFDKATELRRIIQICETTGRGCS